MTHQSKMQPITAPEDNSDQKNLPEKKSKEIARNTIIGDIITDYPFAAEVFMDYGIHCVGCSASSFETLEQGILGHGFSEGELLDIIKELNEIVQNPPEEFEDLLY
jgi:hybrid cluster-associated redox disulfide protein